MAEVTEADKKMLRKMSEDIVHNETVIVKDVFSRLLIGDPHLIYIRMQIVKSILSLTEKKLEEDLDKNMRDILDMLAASVKVVGRDEALKYLKDPKFTEIGVGVLAEKSEDEEEKEEKHVGRDMFG